MTTRIPADVYRRFSAFSELLMCLFVTPGPLGTDVRRSTVNMSSRTQCATTFADFPDWGVPLQMALPRHQRVDPLEVSRLPAALDSLKTLTDGRRRMTPGEIAMSRLIFKDSIDYSQVWIHKEEFLPFGLQPDNCAMTPNGEMYFNPDRFEEDFSALNPDEKWWFMHEMVHVWQFQLGYWVMLRGAIRLGLSYEYALSSGKRLSDYNMEAQGNIIADYFVLKHLKAPIHSAQQNHVNDLPLYEEVLSVFLKDPADRASLP